jgi:hypothetical protein
MAGFYTFLSESIEIMFYKEKEQRWLT